MASLNEIEIKLQASMTTFTNERKQVFSTLLTDQIKHLQSQLNNSRGKAFEGFAVVRVVNEVSEKVVSNVVKSGLAIINASVGPSIGYLTPDVVTVLVGKPLTSNQITSKINELLADIAAATYASEVARMLTDTINCDPKSLPGEEHQQGQQGIAETPNPIDDNLKKLISRAALSASPLGAMYDAEGLRLRSTTFKEVGGVIMGGAWLAGPFAEVVFVVGLGTFLAGAAFEP